MALYLEQIGSNRYAPDQSDAIYLYSTGYEGGSHLTVGQLAIAVSMRTAAAYEAQSVVKMNRMSLGSSTLETAAGYMSDVTEGTGEWSKIKSFCTSVLEIDESTLPDDINTYNNRIRVIAAMKAKVDALTQSQQEDMIDLQTLVNRRDVAFSASSNIVRAFGSSQDNMAANL